MSSANGEGGTARSTGHPAPPSERLRESEHVMTASDGATIHYRAWLPERAASKAVLLFHRGHEHSARWQRTVADLRSEDTAFFAWDARGHGRSSGERGGAPHLGRVIQDADEFARHVSATHGVPLQDTAVLAHSVGAVVAAAWVHDFAPPIRGMVLVTPAFRVKLYVPFAIPALRFRQRWIGPGEVKSYVKSKVLTHDPEQRRAYDADPLIFRQIAVNILLDLNDTSKRLLEDAAAITVPTLVLAAGSDWVVRIDAQRRFVERLGSSSKRFEVLPGFFHAMFHESRRSEVIVRVQRFLDSCFVSRHDRKALLDADKHGPMRDEFDRLSRPGGFMFVPSRAFLRSVGRLSTGVALGWKSGFDSGLTLDYVYENRARGKTPLGRLIDANYLGSIGWRGIRVRRRNLEELLRAAILSTRDEGRPVHLVDIAAGAGRYVIEVIRSLPDVEMTACLRDYRQANLDAAAKRAADAGLQQVTTHLGDAFDEHALASLTPAPTIAIVSGLYELFPENEPVRRSLRGLASAMAPGTRLIYTNQPWHPQVEFIARVLTNREGRPWVMRRRTQAEMDELVRAAGFVKQTQRIDQWGIFSVSVARRA